MAAVFKSYSFFVVGVLFFLKSMFILQTGVHVVLVLMAYSLEHQWYRSIYYLPLTFPRPLQGLSVGSRDAPHNVCPHSFLSSY